jgi:hypothetical protein
MQIRRVIPCLALAVTMAGALANSASAELAAGRAQPAEAAAFASSAKGDNWIAANLFEQARAANDSAANRFNLAVAYESTGRAADAATLYRAILRRPSSHAASNFLIADRDGGAARLAMASDARRNLIRIDARRGQPASADFGVGASASAFVGGPSSGRVSNADARRLDGAARSASGE